MSTWIEIEEPIRRRHCHHCRKEIKGKHLRVYTGSGGVLHFANICKKCIRDFAEKLVNPDEIFKP